MTRSPYAEQIYLLARAAEAEALRESQKRLPALVKAHMDDSMSYEFEARRYGDFLALFIGRGGEKLVTAVNLGITKEIMLTEGYAPDMKGYVYYVVGLKNDSGSQWGNTDYNGDDVGPPPKGYSYTVDWRLPMINQEPRRLIDRLNQKQTTYNRDFGMKWLDWPQWGLALGSDERYAPKWYEFRAYAMGLRDAARIVEDEHWQAGDINPDARSKIFGRRYIKAIHARVLKVLGLPPDDRSGLE